MLMILESVLMIIHEGMGVGKSDDLVKSPDDYLTNPSIPVGCRAGKSVDSLKSSEDNRKIAS
jgi:hypothetical protein